MCSHARTCACAPNQKDDSNTKKIKNNFFYLRKFLSLDAHACMHSRTCARTPNQKDYSNIFFYLRKFLSLDAHACTHARTCPRAPNQKDDSNTKKIKKIVFLPSKISKSGCACV